jgi:hypothetical protein
MGITLSVVSLRNFAQAGTPALNLKRPEFKLVHFADWCSWTNQRSHHNPTGIYAYLLCSGDSNENQSSQADRHDSHLTTERCRWIASTGAPGTAQLTGLQDQPSNLLIRPMGLKSRA